MGCMLVDQVEVILLLGNQKEVECLTEVDKFLVVFLLCPDILTLGTS
ncbi:hypothetical protein SDC9_173819 [bioreactor metagenome]|uniref:Uncharacterized protein n=1 Tax=bioreactor metagenome TaxID=1076179 RepID=A0A645GI81_9ZZZZ